MNRPERITLEKAFDRIDSIDQRLAELAREVAETNKIIVRVAGVAEEDRKRFMDRMQALESDLVRDRDAVVALREEARARLDREVERAAERDEGVAAVAAARDESNAATAEARAREIATAATIAAAEQAKTAGIATETREAVEKLQSQVMELQESAHANTKGIGILQRTNLRLLGAGSLLGGVVIFVLSRAVGV